MKKKLDLKNLDEFSYSSVLREVRKQLDEKDYINFLKVYKLNFDKLYLENKEDLLNITMCKTLIEVNKKMPIEFDKDIFKEYMVSSKIKNASNKYINLIKSGISLSEKNIIRIKAELIDIDNSKEPVFMYINSDLDKYGSLREDILQNLLELE